MNIFKIMTFTAVCFISAGLSAQSEDQKKHLECLDHDIMIWSARNDVVNNVNSLSLKALVAAAVLGACAGSGLYCYKEVFHLSTDTFFSSILAWSSFGALGTAYAAGHLAAGIWTINLILLLYTKYHLFALKAMKERLVQNQQRS